MNFNRDRIVFYCRVFNGYFISILCFYLLVPQWYRLPFHRFNNSIRVLEMVVFISLSLLISKLIFNAGLNELSSLFAKGFWILLLIIWGAFRYGRHVVILLLRFFSVWAIFVTEQNNRSFDGVLQLKLQDFWTFQFLLTAVGLLVILILSSQQIIRKIDE